MDLGESLTHYRQIKDLTIRNVCDQTGIRLAIIVGLEAGLISDPNPRTLQTLADLYEQPYGYLMHLAGYMPTVTADLLSQRSIRMLKKFNQDEVHLVEQLIAVIGKHYADGGEG